MRKVILDIGANSGSFSQYILENVNEAKVIAFEPNPKFEPNFKTLLEIYEGRFYYEIKAVSSISKLRK